MLSCNRFILVCRYILVVCDCFAVDSESLTSSGSASDAEQAESVGRRPSVSASATDGNQQTSVSVDEQHEASSKPADVAPVDSQLQSTDSADDQTSAAPDKCEPDVKLDSERDEVTHAVDVDRQEGTTDMCPVEDVSEPVVSMSSSTEQCHIVEKFSPEPDTVQTATVVKEVVRDVDSPVKTRGKSRVGSRSASSNVDAVADLESSGVDSAPESGKTKPSVEDKTKTPRVKKKFFDEDNSDKIEKKGKIDARKTAREDKAADDEYTNEEEAEVTDKVKEEESGEKSTVTDVKEKDQKQEFESNEQKVKVKGNNGQKPAKSLGTRKGGLSIGSSSAGREKRSRAQSEKTNLSEVAERSVGRGRRKMKLGQTVVVLSEPENSQEPEQYSESSDSASNQLDSKTVKRETCERSSFEGLSAADEFSQKISEVNLANLTAKEPCFRADLCENSSETTNSGAAAGVEHMSRADVVSLLTAAFTDSPVYTSADELGAAGGSSSSSAGGTNSLSPAGDADEEHTSTKSELEANMEVAAYMGAGSTNEAELSSDDDDDDSSSVNTLSRKLSVKSSSSATKRKSDDGSFQHSGKRRRREKQHRTRSQHASAATKPYSYRNDGNASVFITFVILSTFVCL